MAEQTASRRTGHGLAIASYGLATRLLGPFLPLLLNARLNRGKEKAERLAERKGIASIPRPQGKLIWIHAASVGESLSILPLVGRMLAARNDLHLLVTTGTVTSADLMAKNLPPHAFHQFVPLDHPDYCARFMGHWRPDVAVWVESEFWPNLILSAHSHGIVLALINARLTEKSFQGWQRFPQMINTLLGSFSLIFAQDAASAARLRALGAAKVETPGNLKHDAEPLSADEVMLARLRAAIRGRPLWLATNTHEGEEDVAARVHEALKKTYPDILTIIVPRHPVRGIALASSFRQSGLNVSQHSLSEPITAETDIYLGDTMGELGLFYRLCDIVFIGGTLNPVGGHNPFEAARLHASLIAGPSDFNFAEAYAGFERAHAMARIGNESELADSVAKRLADAGLRRTEADAAEKFASETHGATEKICGALLALLPASADLVPAQGSLHHA